MNLPENIRLVKGDDNVFRADSRDVAEDFGKRHDNVVRDIRNLQVSDPEAKLNFEECFYQVNGGRKYPFYRMDRDGFMILAMGFTGPEAVIWKRLYIKSFNAMEKELAKRQTAAINVRDGRQLAEIATQLIELNRELAEEVEGLKPDAESMRLLRSSNGEITMTAMAKMLEVKRPWLFDLLTGCGWFYLQNGAHLPYAPLMKQGYLTVDPGKGKPIMRSSGAIEVKVTTLITAKGISKITEIVRDHLKKDARDEHEEEKAMMEQLNHDDRIYGLGDD